MTDQLREQLSGLTDWEEQEAERAVLSSPAFHGGVILKVDFNDPSWLLPDTISVSLREFSVTQAGVCVLGKRKPARWGSLEFPESPSLRALC